MNELAFLAPAISVLKVLFSAAIPVLSILWTVFWNKQQKQDKAIDDLEKENSRLEKELQKEATDIRERIIKLESTAVTDKQLSQLLKEMTKDMEDRFESKITDLKDFITQILKNSQHNK